MVATPCRKETSYDTYLGYEGLISVSRKHYLRYEGLPHPLNMPYDTVIPPFVRVSYRAVTTSPAPRNADRCSETLKSAPRNAETTPEEHKPDNQNKASCAKSSSAASSAVADSLNAVTPSSAKRSEAAADASRKEPSNVTASGETRNMRSLTPAR